MAENETVFRPVLASSLKLSQKLTTGVPALDNILQGGLPTCGIVEICGESGSGKTQLCLQLCLTAQYSASEGGLEGSVAYICTEDNFPSKRLHELISQCPKKQEVQSKLYGNNIFIEHVADFNGLMDCLTRRVKVLMATKGLKLLIVDSVAAIFRGTYSKTEGAARTHDLRTLGACIHEINSVNNVAVICVNQTTAQVSQGGSNVAALGLAWGNIVTSRLQLFKNSGARRLLKVIFSPTIPSGQVVLTITKCGIVSGI